VRVVFYERSQKKKKKKLRNGRRKRDSCDGDTTLLRILFDAAYSQNDIAANIDQTLALIIIKKTTK